MDQTGLSNSVGKVSALRVCLLLTNFFTAIYFHVFVNMDIFMAIYFHDFLGVFLQKYLVN